MESPEGVARREADFSRYKKIVGSRPPVPCSLGEAIRWVVNDPKDLCGPELVQRFRKYIDLPDDSLFQVAWNKPHIVVPDLYGILDRLVDGFRPYWRKKWIEPNTGRSKGARMTNEAKADKKLRELVTAFCTKYPRPSDRTNEAAASFQMPGMGIKDARHELETLLAAIRELEPYKHANEAFKAATWRIVKKPRTMKKNKKGGRFQREHRGIHVSEEVLRDALEKIKSEKVSAGIDTD